VLEFVRLQTFQREDFTIRSDGVCRLNPEMAKQVVRLASAGLENRVHIPKISSTVQLK
jgi:hypothetical protein